MNETQKRLFLLGRFRSYPYSFRETLYHISQDIIVYAYENLDKSDENFIDYYAPIEQALNDYLIYTEDIWEVMKSYQLPQEADLDVALQSYASDLAFFMACLDRELTRREMK